jgi:hypothetical protein
MRQRGTVAGASAITWALSLAAPVAPHAARSPSGGGGEGGRGEGEDLLSERDLSRIEKEHAEGMTSVQIVDVFTQRGVRFSEATFRKYVQQGLLPRSRRVGRKGKHQGSLGLYPATTVRRINFIKKLMSENHTIEDIQRQFLRYSDEIESLERTAGTIFQGFEDDLKAPRFDTEARRTLKRDVADARRAADELVRLIKSIEQRVAEPHGSPSGGRGTAEDLL